MKKSYQKLSILLLFFCVQFQLFSKCPLPSATVVDASCGWGNDGSITFPVAPGCLFSFGFNGGNLSSQNTFNNLSSGVYTVDIWDHGTSSVYQVQVTVGVQSGPSISNIVVSDNVCEGDMNGSISFTTNANGPSIGYAWSNGVSGQGVPPTLTGLLSGTYTVTITEGATCTAVNSFTVVDLEPITYSTSSTDNACSSSCGGIASINASSPSGVSYLWSNGSTSNQIANLCNGTYTVTVTNGSGCTKTKSFTIGTNPMLSPYWPKDTYHTTGTDDNIKKVLTDKDGYVYVLAEYMNDAYVFPGMPIHVNTAPAQNAFFIAKYDECGGVIWVVQNTNPYPATAIDIEAIDIDFNDDESRLVFFGKTQDYWNHHHDMVSSNGSNISVYQQPNKHVFSLDIEVVNGSYTSSDLEYYSLNYNNDYNRAQRVGNDVYIGGRMGNHASVRRYNTSGQFISTPVYDSELGNSVIDFEVNGIDLYAAINVSGAYNLGNGTVPVAGSDAVLLKTNSAIQTPPSVLSQANCSNIRIHDIEYEAKYYKKLMVVGEYSNNMSGWTPSLSPSISSPITTGYILQFDQNLSPLVAHQLTGGFNSSRATAISIDPDEMMVAGTFNGDGAKIITTVQGVTEIAETAGSAISGVNSMWVASFSLDFPVVKWMLGTITHGDMEVNSIDYDYEKQLFYVGGNFLEDVDLGPTSSYLPHGGGSTGYRPVGFVVRGGELFGPQNDGWFYRRTANEGQLTEVSEDLIYEVFPNPNQGEFQVKVLNDYSGEVKVSALDLRGSIVYEETINKTDQQLDHHLSVTDLPVGVYMLRIQMRNEVEFQKFVVY